MADQRGVCRVWLALIQQRFQPSRGSSEEEGFDSVGHIILLPQKDPEDTEREEMFHDCANERFGSNGGGSPSIDGSLRAPLCPRW